VRISKNKKKIGALEGDHITLINIYNTYSNKNKHTRKKFCSEFYIDERSIIKAIKIKSQLKQYLTIMGIVINKSDDYDDPQSILKSLISGFFQNIALRQVNGTYKNICSNEEMEIHPSSVL
jgi:HrpA-like RNA helicase